MLFQSLCEKTLPEAALMHSSKKKSSNYTINSKENDHAEELFHNKLHGQNRVADCVWAVLCGR